MRPVILLLIVLGQTGCLLAPSRPGGASGGDDDCLPADAKLGLSVTAALERADRDTLIRAAHTGGGWYLYFYPSATRTSRCPERTFQLTGDGTASIVSIDAIEPAVVSGTAPDLLALVSFDNGGSAVIDVHASGGELSEVGRVVASGFQPVPIETLSGPVTTGFVALQPNAELWFGGGGRDIAVASVASGIGGTATRLPGYDLTDYWVHAVAVRHPTATMNFALIGTFASYEAVATSSVINTHRVTEHDALCMSEPICAGRLAFTLSSPGPVDTAEAFSIDRTNGTLETIESMTAGFLIEFHAPPVRGLGSVLDATSGALVGDNRTDVAMLWGSGSTSRELIVYDAMLTNKPGTPVSRKLDARLDRVEILRTDSGSHILLLSDDPLVNPERCLRVSGTKLEDCP
jgi:hypothetical protein